MPALYHPQTPCCDRHVLQPVSALTLLSAQDRDADDWDIDVVAVHALGDDPQHAWVRQLDTPNARGHDHVHWLEDSDMLPALLPRARIHAFNYEPVTNAIAHGRSLVHAEELLTALSWARQEKTERQRPIIFIGHAYGGIIIEQAIIAANPPESEYHHVAAACAGVLLLGTPQSASAELGLGHYLANSAYLFGFSTKWFDLEQLVSEGELIRRVVLNFTKIAEELEIQIACLYEQVPTAYTRYIKDHISVPYSGSPFVVPEEIACIPGEQRAKIGTDHFKLNKFTGPDDESFKTVAAVICDIAAEAAYIVSGRPRPIADNIDESVAGQARIARLLFATDPRRDATRILQHRGPIAEGTCKWILETPEGSEWRDSHCSELLWLCGDSGVGKTYSSMCIAETLRESIDPSRQSLLFALCDSREPERNNAEMILRSLLWQMMQADHSLVGVLAAHYKQGGHNILSGFQSLFILMESFFHHTAREVFCVIDGVNECDPKSQSLLLSSLGRLIDKSQKSQHSFKLLISSRKTEPIEQALLRFSQLELTNGPGLAQDLETYAGTISKSLQEKFSFADDLAETLASNLCERADGNFQWMSLARSLLAKVSTPEMLVPDTQSMPSGLDNMYFHTLSKIDSGSAGLLRNVLTWIVGAVRTLTLDELAIAVFSDQDLAKKSDRVRELLEPCESFLLVRPNAVFILHQSAVDFLSKPRTTVKEAAEVDWNVCTPENQDIMASRCLDFVESSVLSTSPWEIVGNMKFLSQALKKYTFLEYACRYWPRHARESEEDISRWLSFNRPMFQSLSPLRELWFRVFWALWDGHETFHPLELVRGPKRPRKHTRPSPPRQLNLLHIVCFCKLTAVASVLSKGPSWSRMINGMDADGRTPLCFAIQFGTVRLVRFLLNNGADPNLYEPGCPAPVPMAAAKGYLNILRLLLEAGADPNQQGLNNASALMAASTMGYYKIVRLLLEQRTIDVNVPSFDAASPLQVVFDNELTPFDLSKYEQEDGFLHDQEGDAMAAQMRGERLPTPVLDRRDGRRCVMDLLFADPRVDLSVWGGYFGTVLNTAVAKGNLEAVQTLIRKGVNVEAVYDFHASALQTACESGNCVIAETLLEAGASPNFRESSKLSPLQIAAATNNLELVRLLLDYQADPNQPSLAEDSLLCKLQKALFNGRAAFASQVFNAMGVDVFENQDHCHYCSQLEARTSVEDMQSFIGEETNANLEPWTPLQFAAGNGNIEIIRELLDAGAETLATRNHGTTALHLAAAHGREVAVEEFLRQGISPHACRINDGYTPLHCAVENSHPTVVKRLLKITKDIHEPNITGAETPFQLAVSKGNKEIIELFGDLDLSTELIWNDFYKAALYSTALDDEAYFNAFGNKVTAKGGHRVFKQFLEAALLQAAKTGKRSIVNLVIGKGVEVNIVDEHGQTPLQLAVANGHENVARLLLEYGADVNSAMEDGQSVVFTAAAASNAQVLRLVLEREPKIERRTLTGEAALHVAALRGSLDNVKLLVEAGAKVDSVDSARATALIHAVGNGHDQVGLYLLQQGAKIQPKFDETLLHLAVANGCDSVASFILTRNEINVNEENPDGNTPLHYAAHRNQPLAVQLLLDEGANVNAINCDNATPLFIAAGEGNTEVVHLLLDHGAAVNVKASGNMSPIFVASGGGHIEVVALLLQYGANVNCKTSSRKTPLHVAKYLEVWELLIENGADKSARDFKLRKPPKRDDYSPVLEAMDHVLDLDYEWTNRISSFQRTELYV